MTVADLEDAPAAIRPAEAERPLPAFERDYGVILDFLHREALLLDEDRHLEWLDLLASDIAYRLPVRRNVYRRDGQGFVEDTCLLDETHATLAMRVRRSVEIGSSFDRDPPPRMRRMVTNVAARHGERADEWLVTSYLLLLRNRFNDPAYDMLSARREDCIRREAGGLKLARRTIYVDQAALGATYLNVFM